MLKTNHEKKKYFSYIENHLKNNHFIISKFLNTEYNQCLETTSFSTTLISSVEDHSYVLNLMGILKTDPVREKIMDILQMRHKVCVELEKYWEEEDIKKFSKLILLKSFSKLYNKYLFNPYDQKKMFTGAIIKNLTEATDKNIVYFIINKKIKIISLFDERNKKYIIREVSL